MMRRSILSFLLACAIAFSADVTGDWLFEVVLDAGSGTPSFTLKQDGEKLTGTYKGQFGEAPLTGSVKGNVIRFTFKLGGDAGEAVYEGTIESNGTLKGKVSYAGQANGTFTARRK